MGFGALLWVATQGATGGHRRTDNNGDGGLDGPLNDGFANNNGGGGDPGAERRHPTDHDSVKGPEHGNHGADRWPASPPGFQLPDTPTNMPVPQTASDLYFPDGGAQGRHDPGT